MRLRSVTREQFIEAISDSKEDGFAKTFRSKADMGGYWEQCLGAWDEDELMGAIIVTISKRQPYVANLQLLHTFAKHRRKGVGKELCEFSLWKLWIDKYAKYMRVSSEIPAIPFYKKLGWKMLGEQKSGCQLSMMKITSSKYSECSYDTNDPIIDKAINKKGRGGCVKTFYVTNKLKLDL